MITNKTNYVKLPRCHLRCLISIMKLPTYFGDLMVLIKFSIRESSLFCTNRDIFLDQFLLRRLRQHKSRNCLKKVSRLRQNYLFSWWFNGRRGIEVTYDTQFLRQNKEGLFPRIEQQSTILISKLVLFVILPCYSVVKQLTKNQSLSWEVFTWREYISELAFRKHWSVDSTWSNCFSLEQIKRLSFHKSKSWLLWTFTIPKSAYDFWCTWILNSTCSVLLNNTSGIKFDLGHT